MKRIVFILFIALPLCAQTISQSEGTVSLNNNTVQIGSDGNIALASTATAFDDLLGPAYLGRQTAGGKPDFSLDSLAYFFPQNDSTEFLLFRFQIPHRGKVGSTIWPHVHFYQNQGQTPTFRIWHQWCDEGEAMPAWSFVDADTLAAEWTTGKIANIAYTKTGISGSGHSGVSSILLIKLKRMDNVYAGDCLVTDFDIHIEIDGFGSNTEYTK